MSNELEAVIPPASQALLHSQAGPLQAEPSPPYLTPQSSNTHPTSSGHSLHVVVGAVALLNPRRPPRNMCSVRSLTSPKRPSGRGSSTDLQGRRNSSHHQYSARGSQNPPHLVSGRRPSHRGNRQRVTHVGGKPASSGYHPGLAPYQVRSAKVTWRNFCRSRITRCTQDQGKDLPRTSTQPAMSFGGPRHRSRG